jgi:cellulose synthase operon protein C
MNDGFQSAHPEGFATISSGGNPPRSPPGGVTAGFPSPEADSERSARALSISPGNVSAGNVFSGNVFAGNVSAASAAITRRDSRLPRRPPSLEAPLPRWEDARAELPALRAQLRRAELERDVERERLIAAALARALVKRRAELDIALRLGRRAVLLGDDTLRMELASWHCQLGQTELAVGMLVPLLELPGLDRARLAMRIALYYARLGDAEQALGALREAAAHDPGDPLIYELMATVHGWAPRATSAQRAADAYLKGAAERLRHKDTTLAFQDTLRAFDTAPAHEQAADALASAFVARSQPAHADEVWRRHGAALLGAGRFEESSAVHRRRVQIHLDGERLPEALAAALDAQLDASIAAESLLGAVALADVSPEAELEPPPAEQAFDWLLCRLGLWELLAARLELAGEATSGKLASRCRLALGNLIEHQVGNIERALEPWMLAVVSDPKSEAARANLRRYAAATGDFSPLVEALVRVGSQDHRNAPDGAGECLRELWKLSEERLGDTALAAWCVRRALRHEPRADDLQRADQALAGAARDAERELDELLRQIQGLDGDARVAPLRQAAAALRGFPSRSEQYALVLMELAERRPEELRFRRLLETVLGRGLDGVHLSRLWTRDLIDVQGPNLQLRSLIGLARLERQTGNLQGSLAVLAADDARGMLPAASMQLALAAQLGNRRLRAEGMLKVAGSLEPSLRAWFASVASAELLALGDLPAALEAAEVGTHADPSATLPVVAYANAADGRRDRVAAVAYERAMALTFPSSMHCRALAAVLDALGEGYAAQVWTARWLSLRPAETAAAIDLLHGATKTGDAARLGDVIAWTVSQAHPLAGWAEPLAHALTCLADSDRSRAAEVAWRMLDAFGPEQTLRQAVLVVAEQSEDAELEVAVIERELASGGANESALFRLCEKHFECGEIDRGHAVLVRALAAGLDAGRVLALCDSMPEAHSAEGEFHRLQVRAGALEQLGDRSDACWRALRQYGAALWDLARDQEQAVEVWLRAAEIGGIYGWFHFAQDLASVLGLERALDEVCRLAETRQSPDHVAALLTAAAVVSKSRGGRRRALQLGLLALDTDPKSVWALEIIETSALPGDMPAVEGAYKSALGATLGAYGERALHYRAARFFEREGEQQLSLAHAIAAFRAVPSEGVTFALMLRLAQATKETERVARAVEEVAADHPNGRLRSQWLRRAAMIAAGNVDGAQQRMEVLLRALLAAPDGETVDLLGRAFTDLARQQSDGRALAHMRFGRAVAKLVPRLADVEGAQTALRMVGVALGCFSDAKLALAALGGAVRLDVELDDYGDYVEEAGRLAEESEQARAWLLAVAAATDGGQRGSLALLELASEVALALGDMGRAASLLARRIERGPDSDSLRLAAEQAVQKSRDLVLPPHVHGLFPTRAAQAQLLGVAARAQAEDDRAAELTALAEAFELDPALAGEDLVRLLELAGEAGQLPLAERVLAALSGSELESDVWLSSTQRLAALLIEQRRPQRALELLREAAERAPGDADILTQALSAARAAGNDDQRQELLSLLVDATVDTVKKGFLLNEAWEVAKKRGQQDLATEILRRWIEADPEDTQALSRLEAECEARQDWPELVDLLGRHLALGVSFRERRRLALRRAEVLESKLGGLAEARLELAALVEQAPADRTVVERLATVTEQLGDRSAAASAWLTASGLSSTRPAAAALAERACRLFLDAGEVMSARRVLAAPQTLPRTLGLAKLGVRLERDGENEPRLARALEELGAVEDQPATDRAEAWLEAAKLWRRLADESRASHCASEAARLVPDDVEAQILASFLAYRRPGPPARNEARKTVERLRRVLPNVSPEQADLAHFLLAEAQSVLGPEGAGLQELLEVQERLGPTPLISVAIAERLSQGPLPRAALEHFDAALRGGDLRGLRTPSRLALAAAHAALKAELFGLVHRYSKQADLDPELHDEVARLRQSLPNPAPPSLPPKARASLVPSDAPPPSQPASHQPPSAPRTAAPRRPAEFMSAKPRADELEAQTRPARRTQIGIGRPELGRRAGSTEPGGHLAVAGLASQSAGTAIAVRPAEAPAANPEPPSEPRLRAWGREPRQIDEPATRASFQPRTESERERFAALRAGSIDAGQALAEELAGDRDRIDDFCAVSLALVQVEPGSRRSLELLERAAEAAGDVAHAMAVEQVLECSSAESVHAPPPLERQQENVDVLRRLLFSEPDGRGPEALEVIWHSTQRVLEWETPRGLEGVERVGDDERQPLDRLWAAARRLFGVASTPLLRVHTGEYRVNVLMVGEPSVLLAGEPPDAVQLAYDLGAALAGTLPPYAIVNAATYEQIDDLFRAVESAFGPAEASRANFASTARLSALLWESVPPRTQRRMTEWCRQGKLTREAAVASARRAARRAGLFVSGDLAEALGRVASEENIPAELLGGSDGLERLCERSPTAADLVRLATDPAYAHLRWRSELRRPGAGMTRRGL